MLKTSCKKMISLFLTVMLVCSLPAMVFADNGEQQTTPTAIVTLSNATTGEYFSVDFYSEIDEETAVTTAIRLHLLQNKAEEASSTNEIQPRVMVCCQSMQLAMWDYTHHYPVSLPGACTVTAMKARVCTSCLAVHEYIPLSSYQHTHYV